MVFINLIKVILENNGNIEPIIISSDLTNGTGICNPSLFFDGVTLKMIVRHVEYTLFCAEGDQKFQSKFEGPVSYYHPDNDLTLRTNNYYCEVNQDNLKMDKCHKIDTSLLDVKPIWNFIGLEDARLIQWNNTYYGCGVRRDTTTNGTGRMELSELEINSDNVKEIKRNRIEVPDKTSYCEKNWMPIKDKPFHFIKWTNPTEVVKVDLTKNISESIYLSEKKIEVESDLRGGSNIIPWGNSYVAIVHECDFISQNINGFKDADYYHRFVIWNRDFSIKKISGPFNFMTGKIEFCIGLEIIDDSVYIAYSFHDNGSYIVKFNINILEKIINEIL
jgi:hypothetical protein